MQHRHTHECLDHTLCDICDSDAPFGGITTIFSGDPQQTLPVIPRGTEEEILDASLHHSYIWRFITILALQKNERLQRGSEEENFARWLLDIGHAQNTDTTNADVSLPSEIQVNDEDTLINSIYPNLNGPPHPSQYFTDRIILAPRNSDVDELNNSILNCMPGEITTCYSVDLIISEPGADDPSLNDSISIEHLCSLNASGLPPGELHLKVGCPIILLCNLSPSKGLCNGTCLLLHKIMP